MPSEWQIPGVLLTAQMIQAVRCGYLHQLEPDIRHAVLGNAGTLISFRVGPEDASILAKEFQPKFDVEDLLNLPNQSIYLKLMIDGAPSPAFGAKVCNEPGSIPSPARKSRFRRNTVGSS